jgi:hypothetical protein
MPADYLDVDPDVVATAGHSTASTSGDWSAWASQVETQLRSAAASVHEPAVTSALESYLSAWNPRLHGLAANVDALGTNAASAAHVIANADNESATTLGGQGTAALAEGAHLSRPITAM